MASSMAAMTGRMTVTGSVGPRKEHEAFGEDYELPNDGYYESCAACGLADFAQSDSEVILSYHFTPADPTNADQEIARDLAPKLRKLYGHFKTIDRAVFEVSLPSPENEEAWKPYVSFVMTRNLMKETGWSDLLDMDLLSTALEVKRTD